MGRINKKISVTLKQRYSFRLAPRGGVMSARLELDVREIANATATLRRMLVLLTNVVSRGWSNRRARTSGINHRCHQKGWSAEAGQSQVSPACGSPENHHPQSQCTKTHLTRGSGTYRQPQSETAPICGDHHGRHHHSWNGECRI